MTAFPTRRIPPDVSKLLLVFICTLLVARPCAGGAGETGKGPIRLTLPQLIAKAVAISPEVGEAKSDLLAARSSLDQVKAAYLPRLESTALIGPAKDAQAPTIVNNTINDPSPGLSISSLGIFGRLDITLTQPLYTFGKLSNNTKAARYGVAAQQSEVAKTKDDIAYRVSQLYYALVFARLGLSSVKDAQRFFDDEQRRFERLLQIGSTNVGESDLYMIKAYRAEVEHSLVEAQKGQKLATYALRAMLDIPADRPLEVVSEPTEKKEKENLQSLVTKALAHRPEFEQLQNALNARKYQTAAAESELYPSFFIAVLGSLAGAPGREHFDNPYISDEFNHADIGVVAGLRWEFDFGIKKAQVSEARANYEKLLYTSRMAKKSIPIQVAEAYEESVEWEKSAVNYRDAAKAARKWVVTALANFDMGLATATNVLLAIEKYGDNQGKYVQALYNYNVAVAKLRYVTGTIREQSGESTEQ